MKKAFSLFFVLLFVSFFCVNCGEADRRPVKVSDDADSGAADADHEDQTDTDSDPEENDTEEPEVTDDVDPEPDENPDIPDDEPDEPADEDYTVFTFGPYMVNMIDVKENKDDAPRNFRIYEPTGAEGPVPVIHFLHGFMYKDYYYDDILMQLSSHGFLVVSSQSDHGAVAGIGGDTSIEEAAEVVYFIGWLKENLAAKVSVTPDFENFGVAGHSRGGKVTNRVLNTDPTIAKSFFGVDPVDAAPTGQGSKDPQSLNDPVMFTGESMFLGTERGKEKKAGQSCAPEGDNSAKFYASYPSPSHHIIAAGVGHADMVDPDDISACSLYCSACVSSGDSGMNLMFISYTGGLMTAFFNLTLKGETEYEALLNDSSTHPFATTVVEHK